MKTNSFIFGWGFGLVYTSIIAIVSILMDWGIGSFIGIGIVGLICIIFALCEVKE